MSKKRLTLDDVHYSVEECYYARWRGETLHEIAKRNNSNHEVVWRLIVEWSVANDKPCPPRTTREGKPCELTIDTVDKGKIGALNKAHWKIRDIAIDCGCSEEVVEEVLRKGIK